MHIGLTLVGREADNMKADATKLLAELVAKLKELGHKVVSSNVVSNTDNEKEASDGSHRQSTGTTNPGK